MLDIGANVNHADVHNTTPLMDIISLDDQVDICLDAQHNMFLTDNSRN